jgi:non-homologous end joining protein Ku
MSEAVWSEAVWNVVLRLSLISCPVRLVPARLPVDREFERLLSESGGIIDVTHFVPRDPVEDERCDTRYDLYPNGPAAADALDALRAAMQRSGRDAVAFALHGERERMLLIEPYGGGLRLSVMRRPVVAPGAYAEAAEREIAPEMIEIAETAIARRAHEEDANALHDRYEHRLRALIDERTGGTTFSEPSPAASTLARAAQADPEPVPETVPAEEHTEAPANPAAADRLPREIATEILLRIIDIGDRRFDAPGWAGMPGSGRRIEAISIRPREELEPSAIEFRVFAGGDRATRWVSDGNYAGTSGRMLVLTGFGARPAAGIGDRFDVVYEGWFAEGGAVGPLRNGETCLSPVPDDPIEALRVSLIERQSEPPE